MGKKIIFLSDYLNKKKGMKSNKVAPKGETPQEEASSTSHVIDMKAYVQSKSVSLNEMNEKSNEQPQESVDNIVSFKKYQNPSAPSDKEIFIEESNVVFMGDYFKRKKVQKELEEKSFKTPSLPMASVSYGAAAAFLAVLTLSVMLFQGEKTQLALESSQRQEQGVSQQRGLANFQSKAKPTRPQIIDGRHPTSEEIKKGY